jgi:hypothetical protein
MEPDDEVASVDDAAIDASAALTARELQILRSLSLGLSNAKICGSLLSAHATLIAFAATFACTPTSRRSKCEISIEVCPRCRFTPGAPAPRIVPGSDRP